MPCRIPLSGIRRIAVLRASGYSIASIAADVGVSSRTVARVCQRHDIGRSDFRAEAVAQAKVDLLRDSESSAWIKAQLASLLVDDFDSAKRLRDLITKTADVIDGNINDRTDLNDGATAARAVAALATSLKNMADLRRSILPPPGDKDSLPELVICEMTADEIKSARRYASAGGVGIDDDMSE